MNSINAGHTVFKYDKVNEIIYLNDPIKNNANKILILRGFPLFLLGGMEIGHRIKKGRWGQPSYSLECQANI